MFHKMSKIFDEAGSRYVRIEWEASLAVAGIFTLHGVCAGDGTGERAGLRRVESCWW